MAPTRAKGVSKRRAAAKKDLPPYNFNSKGEAVILPLEKRCRFGGCKRRFARYHRLNLHVRQEHGLKISGPMLLRKQCGDMGEVITWMKSVFEDGERGVPAPDVWSKWSYKIPKQAQEYYDYLKSEEEKKNNQQQEEEKEKEEVAETTQATSTTTAAGGEEDASPATNAGSGDEDNNEETRAMLQAMKIDDDEDDYEEEY
ncbi:hypothetical protein F4775DRAFT_595720 [Biscogniauxia sp. FL1348]|nr:hypothetical protein F4775DRAFT_595720 [Biscogniauxia sp. FL1348]